MTWKWTPASTGLFSCGSEESFAAKVELRWNCPMTEAKAGGFLDQCRHVQLVLESLRAVKGIQGICAATRYLFVLAC